MACYLQSNLGIGVRGEVTFRRDINITVKGYGV